jgi:hypothetical protein
MLYNHTTTTFCKVNGGMSTTQLLPDFAVTFKFCASIKHLVANSSTLTFKEKINDGLTID